MFLRFFAKLFITFAKIFVTMIDTVKDMINDSDLIIRKNYFNIFGQRLFLRIIEMATSTTEPLDVTYGKYVRKVEFGDSGEIIVTLPLIDIMIDDDCTCFTTAKRAIEAIKKEIIECKQENGTWASFTLFNEVIFKKNHIILHIEPGLWQAFVNYRKRIGKEELETALKLNCMYSFRFYKIISKQEATELCFNLDDLKKMLGVSDKYQKVHGFIKKVLKPAAKELKEKAPWYFNYKPQYAYKKTQGRQRICGFKLIPVANPKIRDKNLKAKKHGSIMFLRKRQRDLLIQKIGFTEKEILNNASILEIAMRNINLTRLLNRIINFIEKKKPTNPKEYTITSIETELFINGIDYSIN